MNTMGAPNSAVGCDDASANAIGQAISAHVLNGDPLPFVPNNMNGKKAVHVKVRVMVLIESFEVWDLMGIP